jgi:hypothetical protein
MADIAVDAGFPGGNIIVDGIQGDRISIRQDLRDTGGHWFYWCFRVAGAAGRVLEFSFPEGNVIGTRGPAVSVDGGTTWSWLGSTGENPSKFTYRFPPESSEVRFSFGMPYTESNLRAFLARYAGTPHLEAGTLARSRKGREVELLRLGRLDGGCRHRVLLAARHHCCEMMASYSLEGIMEAVLAEDDGGRWFRENAELLVVPFVDKDGVEDGDQGKNRVPRDHGRDYSGKSLYPETAALREMAPRWADGRLRFAMDMHCPWIRGEYNEHAYFVGIDDPADWGKLSAFSRLLEEGRRGPIPYSASGNLPFGTAWNVKGNYDEGGTFHDWVSPLVGPGLACSVEIPYATAGGAGVNASSARSFGADLANAIRACLA